jgi:hypothetical protein
MRRLLVVVLLLASCGSEEPSPTFDDPPVVDDSPASEAPSLADEPPDCDRDFIDCLTALGDYLAAREGYVGMQADSFTLSYQVCSVFEPEEFVDQGFDTPGGSTDPVDVARAYADETYVPESEEAGFEGCLAAFDGRP